MKCLLLLIVLASSNIVFAQSTPKVGVKALNAPTKICIGCNLKGRLIELPLVILNGYILSDSAFNKINPAQIQSIEIFKDAVSIEAYGPKAKNGVVKITAKPEAVDELVKHGLLKPIL